TILRGPGLCGRLGCGSSADSPWKAATSLSNSTRSRARRSSSVSGSSGRSSAASSGVPETADTSSEGSANPDSANSDSAGSSGRPGPGCSLAVLTSMSQPGDPPDEFHASGIDLLGVVVQGGHVRALLQHLLGDVRRGDAGQDHGAVRRVYDRVR